MDQVLTGKDHMNTVLPQWRNEPVLLRKAKQTLLQSLDNHMDTLHRLQVPIDDRQKKSLAIAQQTVFLTMETDDDI